jgi:hypothetical protein
MQSAIATCILNNQDLVIRGHRVETPIPEPIDITVENAEAIFQELRTQANAGNIKLATFGEYTQENNVNSSGGLFIEIAPGINVAL